jgi:primosomal protein N' (replication factor Y)
MSIDDERLFDPAPFDTEKQQRQASDSEAALGLGERLVRVVPDVSGLTKEFDYRCPAKWAGDIDIGSLVRVELHGRRVAGWITGIDVDPATTATIRPLLRVSSIGPPSDVVDLARWAAWRWQGRLSAILKTASPPRMVRTKPAPRPTSLKRPGSTIEHGLSQEAVELYTTLNPNAAVTSVRVGPAADVADLVAAVAGVGNCLVIVPEIRRAQAIAGRLRRHGIRVHLHPNQWAGGFTGGVVIGSRSAVWAPLHDVRAVVVIDEHDESLQEERVPTWNARDVAIERAARAGARCLLVSPAPSLVALERADDQVRLARTVERLHWPLVDVIDRRKDEFGFSNLFSSSLVATLREATSAVLILNRKGRARLLACASCGELVRSENGIHLMVEQEGELVAPATGERRPLICAVCAGTGLRRLRLGVTRAAEELSRLLARPVTEISSDRPGGADSGDVLLGTEAALHVVDRCQVVAFLDFDQELLAPRYRAGEQAMALLVRAARLCRPDDSRSRLVLQTRLPEHRVVRAAVARDPGLLVKGEREIRRNLGFPPFGALAEVSGKGSEEYVANLRAVGHTSIVDPDRLRILGPRPDGRYLISVPDLIDPTVDTPPVASGRAVPDVVRHQDSTSLLASLLAATDRPKERVRVAVDPPRV